MHDDNQLPVLNAVARRGNESIISSTRLGNEVLDELEAMRRDCNGRGGTARMPEQNGAAAIDFTGLGGGVVHLSAELDEADSPDEPTASDEFVDRLDMTLADMPDAHLGEPLVDDRRGGEALIGPDDPTIEIHPMPALASCAQRMESEPAPVAASVATHVAAPVGAPVAALALERRIDELVERHVQALRLELRHLLKGAIAD